MQNSKLKIHHAKFKIQNSSCKIQNSSCKIQNSKLIIFNRVFTARHSPPSSSSATTTTENSSCLIKHSSCLIKHSSSLMTSSSFDGIACAVLPLLSTTDAATARSTDVSSTALPSADSCMVTKRHLSLENHHFSIEKQRKIFICFTKFTCSRCSPVAWLTCSSAVKGYRASSFNPSITASGASVPDQKTDEFGCEKR